jgi:hypothetical protein
MRDPVSGHLMNGRIAVRKELSGEIYKISFTDGIVSRVALLGLCEGFARHDGWFSRII